MSTNEESLIANPILEFLDSIVKAFTFDTSPIETDLSKCSC